MDVISLKWIYCTVVWICIQGVHGQQDEIICVSTARSMNLFCPSDKTIHIQSVIVGKTRSPSSSFCSFPQQQDGHCIQNAPVHVLTDFKSCGTFSSCSRSVTSVDSDALCGAEFQGDTYVIVNYECLSRVSADGQTLEYVDASLFTSIQYPISTMYIISQDYPALVPFPRSVCRLKAIAQSGAALQPYMVSIQVLDLTTSSDPTSSPSSSCAYHLLVIDGLGSELRSLTYCAHNVTGGLTLEGQGRGGAVLKPEDGQVQVAFIRQLDGATGQFWLRMQVLNVDGSESMSGLSVDCSPNMPLLTDPRTTTTTTTTSPSTTTTSTTTTTRTPSPSPPTTTTTAKPGVTTESTGVEMTTFGRKMTTPDGEEGEGGSPGEATTQAGGSNDAVNDEHEIDSFWVIVGAGVGGGLLFLIIIITTTALCYKKRGDKEEQTIKASDLIDAWDDGSSTLNRNKLPKDGDQKSPANKTPPNMIGNIYADIPASHNPSLPPRNASQSTVHSGYSAKSSDQLWNENKPRRKKSVEFDGISNPSFSNGYSRQASRDVGYSRQGSRDNQISRQTSRDHQYSRQGSRDNEYASSQNGGHFTLPHNYSRQSSNQSNGSMHNTNNDPGFSTMPHPQRHHKGNKANRAQPPPVYAKPKIPKRTTSLDQLGGVGDHSDTYETPQDLRGSQGSLYGYSTTLPN